MGGTGEACVRVGGAPVHTRMPKLTCARTRTRGSAQRTFILLFRPACSTSLAKCTSRSPGAGEDMVDGRAARQRRCGFAFDCCDL